MDPRMLILPEIGISPARAFGLAMQPDEDEELGAVSEFPTTERVLRRRSRVLFEDASIAVLVLDEDETTLEFGDVWAIAKPKGDDVRIRRIGVIFGGLFYDAAAIDACHLLRDDAFDHGGCPASVGAVPATFTGDEPTRAA